MSIEALVQLKMSLNCGSATLLLPHRGHGFEISLQLVQTAIVAVTHLEEKLAHSLCNFFQRRSFKMNHLNGALLLHAQQCRRRTHQALIFLRRLSIELVRTIIEFVSLSTGMLPQNCRTMR